ncbi:MAG: phosphomannomutase/phosphoglucomutase, partial [Candidatus Veblenbacteria bacterium]|nr:phosphomannomutase/phosphoglucomutase [Candidatus Veblenbacteria bacterium]
RELSPYAKAPEVNLEVDDKATALARVKSSFADAKIDELDGVTIEYPNWWGNVRPSNTEPLLRVTVEANTPELLREKQQELLKLISS